MDFDYSQAQQGIVTSTRTKSGMSTLEVNLSQIGRTGKLTYGTGSGEVLSIEKTTNALGRVASSKSKYDGYTYKEDFEYDARGQLTKATKTEGAGPAEETYVRGYDAAGNRAAALGAVPVVGNHNRLESLWVPDVNASGGSSATQGVAYEYTYDDEGNRTHARLFGDNRELSDAESSITFDNSNVDPHTGSSVPSEWTTAQSAYGMAHYSDSAADFATVDLFKGSTESITEGRTYRIYVTIPPPDSGSPNSLTMNAVYKLTYLVNGVTVTEERHLNQQLTGSYSVGGKRWQQAFEVFLPEDADLGTVKITIRRGSGSTGLLVVDSVRIERLGGEISYDYDFHNRLTAVTTRVAATTDGTPGRLISKVEYAYDVFDRRIATTTTVAVANESGGYTNQTTKEFYVFDGDNRALTYQVGSSGTPLLVEKRFYSGLDRLAAVQKGDDVYWTLTDEQGSLLAIYGKKPDGSDGLLRTFAYAPDGSYSADAERNHLFVAESNAPKIDVGFQGRERDATTGLYDYRSRFYDTTTGTFISEDGIGIADDLNRYRFNRNSSPNYTDPDGNVAIATVVIVGAVIFAAGYAIQEYADWSLANPDHDWAIHDRDTARWVRAGGQITQAVGLSLAFAPAGAAFTGLVGTTAATAISGSVTGAAAALIYHTGIKEGYGIQEWVGAYGSLAVGLLNPGRYLPGVRGSYKQAMQAAFAGGRAANAWIGSKLNGGPPRQWAYALAANTNKVVSRGGGAWSPESGRLAAAIAPAVYARAKASNPPSKTRWDYIRSWHDKRATDLFGVGKGRSNIGGRNYDKRYMGRDIEYKSDNFARAARSQDSLDRMNTQIGKDIENLRNGTANPHWHFEHDPRTATEMAPLLKRLEDASIPWTWGSSTPNF